MPSCWTALTTITFAIVLRHAFVVTDVLQGKLAASADGAAIFSFSDVTEWQERRSRRMQP
jgi:hypothetical protein